MKNTISGIINLYDIIEGIDIMIDGYLVDAIIDVRICQHGKNQFEIEEFNVKDNKLLLIHPETGEIIKRIDFENPGPLAIIVKKFVDQVDMIAINKAMESEEDLWSYDFVD